MKTLLISLNLVTLLLLLSSRLEAIDADIKYRYLRIELDKEVSANAQALRNLAWYRRLTHYGVDLKTTSIEVRN